MDVFANWTDEAGWIIALGVIVAFALAGFLIHAAITPIVRAAVGEKRPFLRELVRQVRRPTRWVFITIGMRIGAGVAPLPPAGQAWLTQILIILIIVLCGWYALIALNVGAKIYVGRFKMDVEDNLLARKHYTQIRILTRALATLIVVLTIAVALMTLPGVRQYGVSLLAAGGAAGIVVGLALQPLLTNLIAGIQIATTQPIRIDDAVIVEGEWGNVEEITATYVVVRIWDWRRLILPLSYFIQTPFQNWTRETARLIGSAYFYLDYSAPFDAMRKRLDEILDASPYWDKDVKVLQVTDFRERVVEVRCLMSAKDAPTAYDLRCEVREKMMTFLREAHPGALPKTRLDPGDIKPDTPPGPVAMGAV